jgi:putative hemolysin
MEIAMLLLLILLNGVFALSEMAVVSSRQARLQHAANERKAGARAALRLASEPTAFLSTVQIGITLIGILAGALGEAALTGPLEAAFDGVPALQPYAQALALGVVVILITYFSLILGELVPKRLALHNPEAVARVVARPMGVLAALAYPVVRLLSISTEIVLRLLRVKQKVEPPVTEEEIKVMLEQGTAAGVFEKSEHDMVKRVLRLADQRVGSIMTLRGDIYFLDLDQPIATNRRRIIASPYSRIPVCRGGVDRVVGFVQAKELLAHALSGRPFDLLASLRAPLVISRATTPMALVEKFKSSGVHLAMVVDELGNTAGVVTVTDLLEAIVGDLPALGESHDPDAVQREDGSWLLSGQLDMTRFRDIVKLARLPDEGSGTYHTVGGFVMAMLGKVPDVGDIFTWETLRIEVVDMDGNRVDRVLVSMTPGNEELH